MVDGDPALLDEVVTNLLDNAARYAPAKSRVRVELHGIDDHFVVLRVCDHGRGVDPADRANVFQAFWHGPESRSSGLGLAIVRAMVEAHGGAVSVHDTPGGGATFEVRLPARQDASP
jgi:two-component system OmpR family sensor kinase